MELGREAAGFVSATFIKPIKLEFEKARPVAFSGNLGTHEHRQFLFDQCTLGQLNVCSMQMELSASPEAAETGPSENDAKRQSDLVVGATGLLPVLVDQQEALRGPAVHQPRPSRQDGHQGAPLCLTSPVPNPQQIV